MSARKFSFVIFQKILFIGAVALFAANVTMPCQWEEMQAVFGPESWLLKQKTQEEGQTGIPPDRDTECLPIAGTFEFPAQM